MTTSANGNGNLIDEFEESFQQCLNLLTKEEGLGNNAIGLTVNKDEARAEVEQVTLRFVDLARQVEAFFLQKRFLLSALKPELIVKEDITDLKVELVRKEELIKRHYDKITVWQNLLAEMHGWVQPNAGMSNGGQNQQVGNGEAGSSIQHQQLMQQHQQQVQHQQLQQLQQQQLQQQQMHQQQSQGSGQPPQQSIAGVGVPVGQQGMFLGQAGVVSGRGGFPVGGMGSGSLQGPLAYLEKTTSNIGMPEGRS